MHHNFVVLIQKVGVLLLALCSAALWSQNTKYSIDATLDIEHQSISVNQEMTFVNPSHKATQELYLQDWVNAYKDTQTPLAKRFAEEFKRSFYAAAKNKLGFTEIDHLTGKSHTLVWERLPEQPDILRVFLDTALASGESITLTLSYTIKIPDSRFTGMGINDNGKVYLNHWIITLAPFVNGEWLLHSNLDLDDYSGLPANYDLTWHYPKGYYVASNLVELTTEQKDSISTTHFKDQNRIQADFVFDTTNRFISIPLSNGKTVLTDFLPPNSETVDIQQTLERVIRFSDSLYTPFPSTKMLLLKSNYNKNPFYSFSEVQTEIRISKNKIWNLSFFPTSFVYELKYLKAYLDHYAQQNLQIDKRKDHWLLGGIVSYGLIKYVDHYYPDEKLTGSLNKWKPLNLFQLFKPYTATKLPFNELYEFIYEFGQRSNVHQPDLLSKEQLTKFNEKIAIPGHVGTGLHYLEHQNEAIGIANTLKSYLQSHGSLDFETFFQKEQPHSDWFFNYYLKDRKPFDIRIKDLQKSADSIQFSVSSRDQRAIPVKIGLIKNNQLIRSSWIPLSEQDTLITWKREKADFVAVNPFLQLPESNKSNNWKPLHTLFGIKPLQFTFIKDAQNPQTEQIFFQPAVQFNKYDGITTGIRFYNTRIKSRPFEFDFKPQYTYLEKDIVGFFKVDYKHFKPYSRNYLTRYRFSANSYHYNSNYRYSVLIPSITWDFRPENIRDNQGQRLFLGWYNVFRDKSPDIPTNPDYSILNLRHIYNRNNTINYLSSDTSLEFSKSFGKIQYSAEARKLFPSGRQISARLFMGKFFWHNALDTQFFDFNLNRPSDYLFRYGYLGRSETTGIYSQQFIPSEGGFKSIFEESTANDYMLSLNTSAGVWKWIELYGDVGVLKNYGNKAKAYFDSGIKLNLSPDYLEIYLPLLSSNGFELTQARFATKIRFILYPSFRTLTSLFTRRWF